MNKDKNENHLNDEIYFYCTEKGPLREDGTRWTSGEVLAKAEAISRGLLKDEYPNSEEELDNE